MFFNPLYLLFSAPALILMIYAQVRVMSAYGKYSKVANMRSATGAQVARTLMGASGIKNVNIEETPGQLSDHYDPRAKVLRLSRGVFGSTSVAAMGISAHEVGHAIQDYTGFFAMKIRHVLVPVANVGSFMGYIFFILGVLINISGLVWLGVAFFSAAVAFALITLPVELDASRRAKKMLNGLGLVSITEQKAVSAVLSAAALTYVASLLQVVSSLMYYVFVALGMSRRE